MGHAIPPQGHPARDMFDIADLVAIAMGDQKPMLGLIESRCAARRFFQNAGAAVARVVYIVLAADDQLLLVSYGRRLGRKIEWRFGVGLKGS